MRPNMECILYVITFCLAWRQNLVIDTATNYIEQLASNGLLT